MLKQFFRKKDGKPILVEGYYIGDGEEEIFDVNEHHYTDIKPPSKLYDPIYFDNESSEWKGNTYEEWVESLPKDEPVNPSETDLLNAQLISNDIEHNGKINELQEDIANLTAELLAIKGGTDNVSDS
ncbi:MAG TPA: hypothetical protein VK115_06740 [Staphylococcus sp.]|nr:hypothetical protein [Staphylococcus sp.]